MSVDGSTPNSSAEVPDGSKGRSWIGSSIGPASSARTKLGSSTPSGDVPHDQQTSSDGSTFDPHFGQVHIGRSPSRGNSVFRGGGSPAARPAAGGTRNRRGRTGRT